MRGSIRARAAVAVILFLLVVGLVPLPSAVTADPVTFSGTISYTGAHAGDTLYVAVLDTVGVEDVTLLDVAAIAADPPPFSHAYSLDFDNSGASAELLIASFLDVDGGGLDDVGGADVFGWYGEGMMPAAVSSASSQSGLDFSLPRGEIRGTITFVFEQVEARVDVSSDLACMMEGFRPGTYLLAGGPYAINGVYAGTYCVSADGNTMSGSLRICHGDPTCKSPTTITLTEGEVVENVDLDFNDAVPVETTSWGSVKALYR